MATTRLLLGIFFFTFSGSLGMFNRNLLRQKAQDRSKLIGFAENEIGIRERSNHNDGERVETYLHYVGLHRGDPYCAAFVSFIYFRAGFLKPRSGWSPDLFPDSRITKNALPGNIIGIYFPELKRIAHVGLIERIDHDWCVSIEGNTSENGEGGGVYRKRRPIKTIGSIANWINQKRRSP